MKPGLVEGLGSKLRFRSAGAPRSLGRTPSDVCGKTTRSKPLPNMLGRAVFMVRGLSFNSYNAGPCLVVQIEVHVPSQASPVFGAVIWASYQPQESMQGLICFLVQLAVDSSGP